VVVRLQNTIRDYAWGSLTATYNGYLHIVPRLIALAFAPFPVVWSPLLYSATTAAMPLSALSVEWQPCCMSRTTAS